MINNTLNNLLARRFPLLLNFSRAVTTSSVELKCAGGEAGQGVPIPMDGKAVGLQVWDGLAMHSTSLEVDLAAGDRVNLYAAYGGATFTVTLRVNGVDSVLVVSGVAANATLTASLHIILE